MFKLLIVSCVLAVAVAAPQPGVLVAQPLVHSVHAVHSPIVAAHPVAVSHSSSHVVHGAPIAKVITPVHAPLVHHVHAPVYTPIVKTAAIVPAVHAVHAPIVHSAPVLHSGVIVH